MALTKEQFKELRDQGLSIDQIVKFEQGFKPTSTKKDDKTLVQQLVDVGKDFWKGIKGVQNTVDTQVQKSPDLKGFLKGVGSGTLQSLGVGGKALSGIVGAGLETADDLTGEVVSRTGQNVMAKILSTKVGQDALQEIAKTEESWNEWAGKNPLAADNVKAVLNLADGVLSVSGAGAAARTTVAGGRFAKDLVKSGGKAILETKPAQVIKGAKDAVKQGVKDADLRDTALAQTTGLNPDTVKVILNRSDDFTKATAEGLSRSNVAEGVWKKLTKRADDLAETGAKYGAIRASGQQVDLGKGWLDDLIKANGYEIKDGVVTATTKSASRNSTDVNALQKLYSDWAAKSTMDADEFLNLRSDLAEFAKFDRVSGKTAKVEDIAKSIRASLNEKGRPQIDGLKMLDEQFAPEIKEVKALKKEFFDADGNLKDNAINRIANAAGTGRDNLLNRLKKIDPEIEDRVRMVKALEDVALTKGQKVGTYTSTIVSGGLGFATAATVNPAAGFAVFLMTSPTMMVKYLTWMGKNLPRYKRTIRAVTDKIKKGLKLSEEQQKFMQNALNPDVNVREEFLKSLGVTAAFDDTQTEPQQ